MRFYLSGPITGDANFREHFERVKNAVKKQKQDAVIINPAALADIIIDAEHNDYMEICFKLLNNLTDEDAIIQLKGWENSKGACMEYGFAIARDIMILQEGWFEERN